MYSKCWSKCKCHCSDDFHRFSLISLFNCVSFARSDELRKVPSKVQSYTNKRHYLHATKVLMKAIDLGNGRLRDVEGLCELRADLDVRKTQLYQRLLDELNKHLYQLSTADALSNFQRRGSSIRRSNNNFVSPFQRNVMRRSTERAEANAKIRKALFEMAQGFDADKTEVIDETELLDNDLSTSYFIGIIVECFALLRKVPESLDALKVQIQPELLAIVTRTTQHLNSVIAAEANGQNVVIEPNHPLLELIDLIYKQLKLVANAHNLLLKNYLNVTQRHAITVKPYDIADYWTQAQAVVSSSACSAVGIEPYSFLNCPFPATITVDRLLGHSEHIER